MKRLSYLVILFFFSCQSDLPEQQSLIDKYYNIKWDALKTEKDLLCRTKAYGSAKKDVDSLMNKWFDSNLFDTISFPNRPIKPNAPDHIIDEVEKF